MSKKSVRKKVEEFNREKGCYHIAELLMEFLLERGVIGMVSGIRKEGGEPPIRVKGGDYILKSTSYVEV